MRLLLPLVGSLFCGIACAASTVFVEKKYTSPLGIPLQVLSNPVYFFTTGPPLYVSRNIYRTEKVPFVEETNPPWLGFQVDFKYIKPLFDELNSTATPLLNRGESHITVITPPEFTVLAAANITIDEINTIARAQHIQSSRFKIVCLGKESIIKDGKDYTVYQIIVSSPDLVTIREKIFHLYYSRGGNTALFDPRTMWPHITVGYTISDLFVEMGIYKSANVCYRPLSTH
ncbi:hypothetical protein BDF14DRAFT_1885219 [Spinellus fusiger]|nr:hypothetical protein BDF14DRAFT_1885219 [Spinellus fusiger]